MTEKKITCCGIRPLIYCISREEGDPYLIHNYDGAVEFPPVTRCFILPFQGQGEYRSYEVKSKEPFQIYISADEMEVTVSVDKEDTVSQLEMCIRDRLPAETQPLFSVTGLVDVFKVHLQLSQGDDQSFSYDIFIFNNQKCHNLLRSLRNFSSCSFVGMETGREIVLQAPPKSEEENVKE